MSKATNCLVIFLITLISLVSFAGPVAAEAVDDALVQDSILPDTLEDLFDSIVSYVWKFISPALSMDARIAPSPMSVGNH
ncbi:MAG TPA: hypothetical protein VN631_00010 [Negativicutes bacterium]|nr:hypothetical protein [Negativicutes bacterium]